MTSPTITYQDQGTKGRYIARIEGSDEVAEATFSKASNTLLIVDHTFVPDAARGTGLAAALAQRAIADARLAGQKIVPLCPFFRAYATRHRDELGDVIQW